ncbi:MAG: hypothetical protein H0T20_10110 [Actinobacteria bacterium]|nr:hypothetical protein [Actinomycetota bacterium]
MKVWSAAALGAIALAGCGGNDTAGASAIGLAPADAFGYVELDTSLDSDQWRKVQALLDRFPSRPQLVVELDKQLSEEQLQWERDVDPALGETVSAIWVGNAADDVVVATQPDDEAKLRTLVDKLADQADTEYVIGEVDGWTAVAEQQSSIDALKSGDGELADNDGYQAALGELPDERLAFGWVSERALPANFPKLEFEWIAGAIEARDDGAAATFVERLTGEAGASYTSRRIDEAPADSLAFLSFDTKSLRGQTSSLAPLANLLGVRVDQLIADIEGEGAFWVLPAAGFPELTLVLTTSSPERTQQQLRQLFEGAPLPIRIGVVDSQVVATTASSPAQALERARVGGSLGDDEDFREAKATAGMPDETGGFLYLDVADALPLLSLAGFAGVDVPKELLENLRPIRSVVAWSQTDGTASAQTVFVHIQ